MQRYLRLRQSSQFARLRSEGRVWGGRALLLSLAPNGLKHNRYGFIVSKRVGKAVARNRLRRQLRACLRSFDGQLTQGYDLALIARPALAKLDYAAICEQVGALLEQAKLLPNPAGNGRR